MLAIWATFSSGAGEVRAEVTYLYDGVGQLKRVINEQGEVRTYNYDAVGNILSIEAGEGNCPIGPPVVTGSTPSSCLAGTTCPVTIEGTSLLGSAVTSDIFDAAVTHCREEVECLRITCLLTPSPFMQPGTVNVVLTSPLGSAQIPIEILPPPTLRGRGQADSWYFVANKDDVITLTMTRIANQADGSSTLDPRLEIEDSRGFLLKSDDDSGTNVPPGPGRNAVIQSFTLPATDTYTVIARGGNGTAGPYVLESMPPSIVLTRRPPEPTEPAFVFQGTISAVPAPAQPAFTFQGTVASPAETDTFTFPANLGTKATIQVNRVANNPNGSGTLDPAVELRDSRGFLLAQDNDIGTNLPPGPGRNALVFNFTLGATDTYSVVAKGADGTTGPYEVKVIFGPLAAEIETDTFTFPANAGAVATIEVTRVANNPDGTSTLDPAVELRDSRGVLIARDDDTGTNVPWGPGRNAVIPRVTLRATDTYSLAVRGSNGTVGLYRVAVTLLPP